MEEREECFSSDDESWRGSDIDDDLSAEDKNKAIAKSGQGSNSKDPGIVLRQDFESQSSKRPDEKERNVKAGNSVDESRYSINRLGRNNHQNMQPKNTRMGSIFGVEGPQLSWKSDPDTSFSDWRVEVFYNDFGECDVYHLHRNIVAYGTRKSGYLTREIIQQSDSSECLDVYRTEKEANITRFDLPESEAQVFPIVLDFMYYTREVKQKLSAQKACAVYKLSVKLEISALKKSIIEFYSKNLSFQNMKEFFDAASRAKIDRLLIACRAKIGTMVTEKPELAGLVHPTCLADTLEFSQQELEELRAKYPEKYPKEMEISQSKHWSKVAYVCASRNQNTMTTGLFEKLTSEKSLPAIDTSVALKFFDLDVKFLGGSSEFTSLQRRCVKSITDEWEIFQKEYPSSEAAMASLQGLPQHALERILAKSMNGS